MKENQETPLHHHNRRPIAATVFHRNSITKPTAYVTLLLLSFFLGYFSSPPSSTSLYHPPLPPPIQTIIARSATSPPPPPIQTIIARSATTTATATATTTAADHYNFGTHCSNPVPPNLVRQTILDHVFNGTSPYTDFPPAHVSPLLRQKRITGWGSNGAVFENLIRKVRPKIIIEIGTFLGASAIHMAQLARQLGLETQILCVDDFRGWPDFREMFPGMKMLNGDVMLMYQYMQNVAYVNETESIIFLPFSTGSTLQKMCEWGVFADLIEVDAGHDFHSAWQDINRAYKLLSPGGVIFGHDYFTGADNKGVRRAVNLFARVNGLQVKVDGQHWVIGSV